MVKPTPEMIDEESHLNFAELEYSPIETIQPLIDQSWAWLGWVTGRAPPPMEGWADAALEPLVSLATRVKVEALAYQNQPDQVETVSDFMVISSFSAGSYSETRRDPKDLLAAGFIDADPRLNSMLWPLMTEEKKEDWLALLSGKPAPSFEVTEVIWGPHTVYDDLMNAPVDEAERWQSYF